MDVFWGGVGVVGLAGEEAGSLPVGRGECLGRRILCLPFSSMTMSSVGGPGSGAREGLMVAGKMWRSLLSWRPYWPGLAIRSTVVKEGVEARWMSDWSGAMVDVQPLACAPSILFSLWTLC